MSGFPRELPCPKTGRAFSSGYDLGSVVELEISEHRSFCPHCGKYHRVDYPPLLVDGEPVAARRSGLLTTVRRAFRLNP